MRKPSTQHGGATLAVTLVLLLAVTLAALYAQRRHVAELRSGASQAAATQAYEAAEAGLAWATAMLDDPRALDVQCRPASGAGTTFRDRHLAIAPASGSIVPLTTDVGGAPVARRAACVRAAAGWQCRCAGEPAPRPDVGDADPAAAFVVRFTRSPTPGLVQLDAIGCARLPCPESGDDGAAWVRLDVLLGLLPGLAQPPLAPLTARADIDAGAAALGLHNSDPAVGGIAAHAGGLVRAPNARWSAPAGAPSATQLELDGTLRDMDGERLFASLFGLDKARWRQGPAVAELACDDRCNAAVVQALAIHRAVHVTGALALEGPVALGTPERPVIVVADGAVALRGAVRLHGLLYAASIAWDDAPAGGLVRGAVVSEGGYRGTGAPDLVYDGAILAALKDTGRFARLPGSWRDFR